MAQKPPQGKDAFPVTDQAFQVRAEIDLDAFYQRLLNETRRLVTDYSQQGLEGKALADKVAAGLKELSPGAIDNAARFETAEAFNLGRNLEAQVRQAEIGEVVRTEILDENTCPPCRRLDGKVVELNSEEYFELMPPNLCDGRELCRGFYLYRAA
ncbi:MAG TPA: hypothetical protein VKF61_06475 [Candidatus Polarisedimenticolia bacterium]|nr:hypothetical protein [Candidatus Polarisedimenticolia bacterium]